MNKNFLFLFCIISLIFISCLSLVSAVNIAYVVQNPSHLNYNERVIKDILIENDYTVNIRDDVSFDASEHDVVIVSESVSSIEKIFDNKYHKTLFLSNIAAKNAGLSSGGGVTSGTRVYIDNQNIITKDFSLGELQIYYSQGEINYIHGCKAIGAESLVYKSDPNKSVLLFLDKNSLLLDGSCSKRDIEISERNLFFGLIESSKWNLNARRLFLNSLDWLINGIDNDEDGYKVEEDCNDNDASIHPNALELIDNIDQNCVDDDPVFIGEIEDISWSVNQRVINAINLNDYFKDPDGDNLIFESEISVSEIQVSINNGWVSFSSSENWEGEGWIIFKAEDNRGNIISNEVVLRVGEQDIEVNEDNTLTENQGSYNFKKISRMEKNENVEVNIRSPAEGRTVDIGSKINVRVEIKNEADEDLEFDVDIYLYDLTNDEIVEDLSYSIEVDNGKRIISTKEIEISEDLDEDNEYAIFVKALDSNYYNEDYVEIDLVRAEEKVIIDRFSIDPEIVSCGDYVDMKVGVYNVGKNEQDVYIKVKNSDLKISEESENFELEKYSEKDSKNEGLRVKIPENVESGEYIIKASVLFDGRSDSLDKKLVVNCESNKDNELVDVSPEILDNSEPVKVKKDVFDFGVLFLVWGILGLGGIIAIILVLSYFRFRR